MGTLVLMSSGELTATMVEVHKMLLSRHGSTPKAVFLDTPAGFQLNADQISANAVDYFRKRVGCEMSVASYKSHDTTSEVDAALAFQRLREADFILMGPGSPTYTVNQLLPSAIQKIFIDHIKNNGCLVTASAAALTAGRFTLPVYEIYKVGTELHWVKGLDILASIGLGLVVIPHWNNAEGGTHDTSRCFMGKSRYEDLITKLPEPLPILGLDEHTACVINITDNTFEVYGIGTVTYNHNGQSQQFHSGETYPLSALRGSGELHVKSSSGRQVKETDTESDTDEASEFWKHVHSLTDNFQQGISTDDAKVSANALLELDRILWQAHGNLENPDIIAQARDLYREQLAIIGTRKFLSTSSLTKALTPAVDHLMMMRQRYRDENNYQAADSLRDALSDAGIVIKDTTEGFSWSFTETKESQDDQSS